MEPLYTKTLEKQMEGQKNPHIKCRNFMLYLQTLEPALF